MFRAQDGCHSLLTLPNTKKGFKLGSFIELKLYMVVAESHLMYLTLSQKITYHFFQSLTKNSYSVIS